MKTSHRHRWYFARGSNKAKGFFFCQSPAATFPGGRRTYEEWQDGKPSSWIMNVVFLRVSCLTQSERFQPGRVKVEIMEGNYYPRTYRTGHVILLNWLSRTIVCPTHPTVHWGSLLVDPHQYFVVLNLVLPALDFGMSDMWFVIAVL